MASVELVPEELPAVNPVPVQEVALVEDHDRVDDCPLSMVVGEAESVAVGANVLQNCGLFAPLIHTNEPSGLETLPPTPVHPPLLQATHDEPL